MYKVTGNIVSLISKLLNINFLFIVYNITLATCSGNVDLSWAYLPNCDYVASNNSLFNYISFIVSHIWFDFTFLYICDCYLKPFDSKCSARLNVCGAKLWADEVFLSQLL